MEEKPKYGWYVKSLIVTFIPIGLVGLLLLIFGIIIRAIIGLLLIIGGAALIVFFLWPGLGMMALNLSLKEAFDMTSRMPALREIKSPEILDVGCGTGRTALKIAKSLKNGGHLYGIDIYEKMAISGNALDTILKNAELEGVQEKTTFQFGSATEIPFEDSRFDIHEVHNDEEKIKALKEIYRVLKPEGYLYIGEWNRIAWQTFIFTGIFMLVFKSNRYWRDLFANQGFKILSYNNVNGYGIFEMKKV